MAELDPSSAKYIITANLKSEGIVEKSDVVGAIFGQTEGLLGPKLDLRELQMHGKVGRIQVSIDTENGKTEAVMRIPCSLDSTQTAIIAASLETIERVGPCLAELTVGSVDDVRVSKRDYIVKRAKEILQDMRQEGMKPEDLSDKINEEFAIPTPESIQGMPAGPDVREANDIVVVEGRADIRSLLEAGITNGIAVGGTAIPDDLIDVVSEKEITVFLDGDRGGELILKELSQRIDIDYVAKAPEGREVEDLSPSTIQEVLREKDVFSEAVTNDSPPENREGGVNDTVSDETKEACLNLLDDLIGTRAAYLLSDKLRTVAKVPVSRIADQLMSTDDVFAVVFDGVVDPAIAEVAADHEVNLIVGMEQTTSRDDVVCLARDALRGELQNR